MRHLLPSLRICASAARRPTRSPSLRATVPPRDGERRAWPDTWGRRSYDGLKAYRIAGLVKDHRTVVLGKKARQRVVTGVTASSIVSAFNFRKEDQHWAKLRVRERSGDLLNRKQQQNAGSERVCTSRCISQCKHGQRFCPASGNDSHPTLCGPGRGEGGGGGGGGAGVARVAWLAPFAPVARVSKIGFLNARPQSGMLSAKAERRTKSAVGLPRRASPLRLCRFAPATASPG